MGDHVLLDLVLGFSFGYLLQRGGLCTVAAISQVVSGRGVSRLGGIATTVAWAAIPLLVSALAAPDHTLLAASSPVVWPIALGAVALGVGSALNGGCFVGSVARAAAGDSNWLATFAGMATASLFVQEL